MTAHAGPLYGERLNKASAGAQVLAFPGVWCIAERLQQRSNEWLGGDPDAELVSAAVLKRAAKAALRMPGLRDILVVGHPVVTRLVEKLDADRAHIPAPDLRIVTELEKLQGFAFDGTIVSINAVPVPAGKRQTDYFMVQRYRSLYGPQALPHLVYLHDLNAIAEADHAALGVADGATPDLIHLLAYDAANVTDDMQEALLSYSTAIHRDNLVALQRDRPSLYVAIWRRDMQLAKRLARVRRDLPLPPSNTKSVRTRAKRLLDGASLMHEIERLFEIIEALKPAGGATRQSLQQTLKSSSSMTAVRAVGDTTRRFLAGSVAHVRSVHPTMNTKEVKPKTADPILEQTRTAFFNARAYWEKTRRVEWIADAMPAQWFLGIELAMLAPVALIQMIWNMARRENSFWLRGKRGDAADASDERRAMVIELAVIITANICPATARSMLPPDKVDLALDNIDLARSDLNWRDAVVPTLIGNPKLAEEIEARANEIGIAWLVPGNADCDRPRRSSPYDRAMLRALGQTELDRPGWTQGFLFEAWQRPNAELAFLRSCCRYVSYDPAQSSKRNAWNATFTQVPRRDRRPVIATDIATGLPRQHPLERIQDLFRDSFDRLQVAELANDRATTTARQRAKREAAIAEVAPLLAAVSPITLDPQLAERWWRDLDDDMVAIAREGAWNT